MKTYTLGISDKAMPGKLNWKDKLEAARDAGYDFAEMVIDEMNGSLKQLDRSRDWQEEMNRTIQVVGIPIRTICLHIHKSYPMGSSNEKTCAKSLNILEKAVILAAQIGHADVQISGYDVYYELSTEETRKRFKNNLKKVVSIASRYGVTLVLKPVETEFMNTTEKASAYVKEINSEYLRLCLDIGNITNAAKLHGKDVLKDIKFSEGHCRSLQLKESLPGQYEDVLFGGGHVDFARVINAAWKMGVRKYTIEINGRDNPNWRVDMIIVRRQMERLLDKMNG